MKHSNTTCGLSQRRHMMETQWSRFISGSPFLNQDDINEDILSSWQRSSQYIPSQQHCPPAEDAYDTVQRWQGSPLAQAAQYEQENLKQLTQEGDLVAAIASPRGQLLWTFASSHMYSRAESVNFIAGGYWDERSAGTNAVGLAQKLRRAVTVFSSEHYQAYVHDWVCYAAPIMHPQTGECIGILDISTTWKRHTPLGQIAVNDLARSIANGLPKELPRAALEIHALGQPRVLLHGKELKLTKRQIEILCLLTLNPQGLRLDPFHAALYGDAKTSTSTLKAELSQLRRLLDGKIGSRPYRLTLPVWADFIEVWQALRQQRCNKAISLYRGTFLPQSESPELEEWRNCIDAVMGQALNTCEDPRLLMDKLCQSSSGSELVRERLAELVARDSHTSW